MGTWVVCTRLQVAPDGVSSKTVSALPLTLKTSTGGASAVGVSPGIATPVAPGGGGGREDQARPPGPTSKTARWDFGLVTRTATRPSAPTALARTESAPGTGSGADMVQPESLCAHATSSARCPAAPTLASTVVAPPDVSNRKTPVADPPRPTVTVGPVKCHEPSTWLNRPTRPPRSQPAATSGAPLPENATAAIAETAQEGPARRSAAVETSGPQEPRFLGAAKTVPSSHDGQPGAWAGRLDRQCIDRGGQGARQEEGTPRRPSITARGQGRETEQRAREHSGGDRIARDARNQAPVVGRPLRCDQRPAGGAR